MKQRDKIIAAIVGAVFLVSVLLSVLLLRHSSRTLVEIVQDGTVIQTIDIANAEDQEIRIPSLDGTSYNLVTVKDGTIAVTEAGCPDQTCVHMGVLRSESLPIVCLPNRLIVRFAEESP